MKSHRFLRAGLLARLASVVAAPVLAAGAAAQTALAAPSTVVAEGKSLQEIVISATRTPERADAVASTITAQDAQKIERAQPVDETGLFADEPGVDVPRDRRRYGAGSINIRGIEDNRVLQMVDGVRLPDYYNGGGPSNISTASRDTPEFSFLKRVEVLRGPASSLYGSDAIGGVVSYVTKDPEDVMRGKAVGAELGLSWNGIDQGFGQSAAVAGGNDQVKGILMVAHRKAQEMGNMGTDGSVSTARTEPNPQDAESQAWLGKIVFDPSAEHRFKLSYEHRDGDTWTEVLRLSPSLPRVTSASGSEDAKRDRYALEYEWKPASRVLDRLSAQIHHQSGETGTATRQLRSGTSASCSATTRGTNQCAVDMDFDFKQRSDGLSVQADKSFATGSVGHRLIGGVDYQRTQSQELRDALITNLTRGSSSKSLAGETFPIHDFPAGQSRQIGAFLQDEIAFADGRFTLTPGLRYDRYSLDPDEDAVYNAAAARPAVSQDNSAVSPKLAALWKVTDRASLWSQYVYGFRAPNYQEVNGSFRNTVMAYGAVPNADLNPEKSRSFEIGARYVADALQTSVSVFDNRYQDFIEQMQLNCPGDANCIPGFRATYQYRNQSRVRIYGAEWRAAWRFAPQWSVDGAIAYANGRNQETGEPLNTVSPLRGSVGLTWELESGKGAGLRWRGANTVTRTDDSNFAYFKPPGYGVVDLQTWWRLGRNTRIVLSVNNLLDKKYWLWGDVRQAGVEASEPGKDFYTQSGRSFAASLKVSF